MATQKRPERRSLSGLLGQAQALTQQTDSLLNVPIADLYPFAKQPRRVFPKEELATLAESIRERGVLQPLLVRPRAAGGYEIAAGERRWHASIQVGLPELPVLVRDFSDQEMLEVGLIENLQRQNLSPLDEIEGKIRLLAHLLGVSEAEVKPKLMTNLRTPIPEETELFAEAFRLVGRETWQSFAKNKVRVLGWPEVVLTALRGGEITLGQGSVLAGAGQYTEDLLEKAKQGASVAVLRRALVEKQQVEQEDSEEFKALDNTLEKGRKALGGVVVSRLKAEEREALMAWLAQIPKWLQK